VPIDEVCDSSPTFIGWKCFPVSSSQLTPSPYSPLLPLPLWWSKRSRLRWVSRINHHHNHLLHSPSPLLPIRDGAGCGSERTSSSCSRTICLGSVTAPTSLSLFSLAVTHLLAQCQESVATGVLEFLNMSCKKFPNITYAPNHLCILMSGSKRTDKKRAACIWQMRGSRNERGKVWSPG
jgi:hypothetical protein